MVFQLLNIRLSRAGVHPGRIDSISFENDRGSELDVPEIGRLDKEFMEKRSGLNTSLALGPRVGSVMEMA